MATYELKLHIYNRTNLTLTMIDASVDPGSWNDRFPSTLAPNSVQTGTAESWNANGLFMNITYSCPDGSTCIIIPPHVNPWGTSNTNEVEITNNNGHWSVNHNIDSGSHPAANVEIFYK